MPGIHGMNIVITGANSGIGLEMLKQLSHDNILVAADLHTDILDGLSESNGNIRPYQCDISSEEGIDELFCYSVDVLKHIDMFIANAGIVYYEKLGVPDWGHIEHIYRTDVFSPIYSYEKFVPHLNGRKGIFVMTDSAMGIMGYPGFSLYSSGKFALNGFQDSLRYEQPENVQVSVIYPVSTNTNFFRLSDGTEFYKPFPVQSPSSVASKAIKGIGKGKRRIFPCRLFRISMFLFTIFPFIKRIYMNKGLKKLNDTVHKK